MKRPIIKFYMNVPLSFLLALLLIASFSSCSKPNLGDIVREHIRAVNSGDIEKNLTFFTNDAILEIGAGTRLSGKDQLRNLMESDATNKARLTILDMKVEGNTVIARLTGKNEFLRLLGVEESSQRCTYKFRGRFLERVIVEFPEGGGLFDKKYKLFAEWAGREHSLEFKKMDAGGYTAESTRLLLGLAKEWRAKTDTERVSVEQELIKLENDSLQAFFKNDIVFYERFLADDYMGTDEHGNVRTKTQEIAEIKAGEHLSTSGVKDNIKVRVFGEVAVVTGRDIMKGLYEGKEYSSPYLWTDIFIKRGGRWQCVASHVSKPISKQK